MDSFFRVTVSGEETLTNDFNDFIKDLAYPILSGLTAVGDGMSANLMQHIQEEVYDAYTPKSYPRRWDPRRGGNTGFGESIIEQVKKADVRTLSLSFVYEPHGYHSGRMQDAIDAYEDDKDGIRKPTARTERSFNRPLKPNPVHGDKLINRIQTGKGYDWKGDFPARPFWDSFVGEQKNGAIIENFASGFNRAGFDLILEGNNKDLEWNFNEGKVSGNDFSADFDDDDELPLYPF